MLKRSSQTDGRQQVKAGNELNGDEATRKLGCSNLHPQWFATARTNKEVGK